MNILNGKERVVISGITPRIEGGKYPAKRAIGETLTVTADIFTDGHDEIAASTLIRLKDKEEWLEYPMSFISNDQWQTTIPLDEIGLHEYQVIGWVDHFTSWKKGLVKKYNANQDVSVELQIGADMFGHAQTLANEVETEKLLTWIQQINTAPDIESSISVVLKEEVAYLMRSLREADLITKSDEIYRIEVERKKAAFSSWYELFPRSASSEPGRHGNFQDVKRLLPGIAKMGFDTLYFPPIHPIGEMKRKGKNNSLTPAADDPGSPWAIGNKLGGHKDIHPELGTIQDFEELVAEAKKVNIEVAMDIAYQCAPDHPYVKEHPQWFKWRPDGTVQYAENPPKKYEDILPFNFETEDWANLWSELKSVIDYWIEKGVHIFRIDNPHTKAFAFWEWMIGEVRLKHPEVIFLAEAFTRPRVMEKLAKAGFNQSYSYFTWRNSKWEFEQYLTELTKTDLQYYFRPNFWPNTPDILPHHLVEGGENAHIMRLILAATMSSNYGLYGPVYEYGVNTPHPGKEEYTDNEKYEIKQWDWDRYSRTREIISLVNKLRKDNPALQTTWNIDFTFTDNDQVICYSKTDKNASDSLVIVVNLDAFNTQGAHIRVPLERFGMSYESSYTVKDMLSGEKYHWHGEYNFIQLNPYDMPAHIFKIEQTNQN